MIDSDPILPAGFATRLERLLPPAALDGWRAAFAAPPVAAFRVNGLRATEAGALAELAAAGLAPQRLVWPETAWVVPPEQRRILGDSPAARDGRIYLQNPSSAVPVLALDPRPGEEVLDLTAAPGGKTVHIAQLMGNRGRIAAVESASGRFHRLRRNLERCGVAIAQTYLADGAGVGRKVPERFDRVLLDAPCSAEGRFSSHDPDSWRYWSLKKIREMARKQRRLALSAAQALKPGGVLVYSTCTLAPEENEEIVDGLLQRCAGAVELEPLDLPDTCVAPGLTAWEGRAFDAAVRRCARVLPDPQREAFFVARLRKVRSLEAVR